MTAAAARPLPASSVADDVRRGLTARPKRLPAYLLYDAAGSRLFERITALPEYYLGRAEREIFAAHAAEIVACARGGSARSIRVVELGAGSASKTEVVLRAVLEGQGTCLYVPVDVSRTALDEAEARLEAHLPGVRTRPLAMPHEQALRVLSPVGSPTLVLFIGSSIGNLADVDAASLLRRVRAALGASTSLLLGTDLRKSPGVLVPAYDDAAGVTAAFNKNVLARINRELGGRFDLDRFRHVARWNDAASRIEMHLESVVAQDVGVEALGLRARFYEGETIHTESSVKYDQPRVDRLLAAGGFALEASFHDRRRRFAVHVARAC